MEKTYLCIDLKSFYASVECAERGLDAMTHHCAQPYWGDERRQTPDMSGDDSGA